MPRFASLVSALLCGGLLVAQAATVPARAQPALPTLQPVQLQNPAPSLQGTLIPLGPGVGPQLPAAQPPAPSSTFSEPRDPLYPQQWNLQTIRMPQAWAQWQAQKPTGKPVTVAVLDTGYVPSPELAGRVVNGYDFVSDAARAADGNGRDADASAVGQFAYHGEIVANLIAAAHDGRGMAGINPRARIVHVRVADVNGEIAPQDLIDGLRWAAGLSVPGVPSNPNPARIVNLSLFADFIPLTGCDARIQKAVDEVAARGVLVVAGAGNDGKDASGYSPAGCRNTLTVTTVNEAGQRPAYANWGRTVALAAPGGEPRRELVASSLSGMGGERHTNGTSFAAPQVSGVASLLLDVRPNLTRFGLSQLLTRQATPFAAGRCDSLSAHTCGAGLLNAEASLRATLASSLGR